MAIVSGNRYLLTCLAIGFLAGPANAGLTEADFRPLLSLKQRIEQQNSALIQLESKHRSADAELEALRKRSAAFDREIEAVRREREELENFDRERPGIIPGEKLMEARRKIDSAIEKRNKHEAQVKDIQGRNQQAMFPYEQQKHELEGAQKQYNAQFEKVVDKLFAERVTEYSRPRTVEATGTASCGDQSVKACKAAAEKEAERVASEQGTAIMIESVTELNNNRLTQDFVRSEMKSTITNRQVKTKLIGDEIAQATMSATVTPVLSSGFRKQLRESLSLEVQGQVDSGDVPAPTPVRPVINDQLKPHGSEQLEAMDWHNKAIKAAALGNWTEAVQMSSSALKLAPTLPAIYLTRGKAYYEANFSQEALADINEAIKLEPNLVEGFLIRANIHHRIGMRGKAEGDFERACLGGINDACRRFKEMAGYDPSNSREKAAHLLKRNLEAFRERRHQDAIDFGLELLRVDPRSTQAMNNVAASYLALGKSEMAQEMIERSISIDPNQPLAYNIRGLIHERSGKRSDAMADFSVACSQHKLAVACSNLKRANEKSAN